MRITSAWRLLGMVAITVAGAGGASVAAGRGDATDVPVRGVVKRQDLEIVDCALPGQVRVLGGRTYISPRKPAKLIVTECRVRGGEYVEYDRANLQTALKVWLESAQLGDADAQTTVGEIYERGLGVPPDHAKAVEWYQKAAAQHYSRALFNLGTLYEQGLGVEQDTLKALNLYREAGGMKGNIGFEDVYLAEQERQRAELQATIDERKAEIDALQSQVDELDRKVIAQSSVNAGSAAQLATLRKLVADLERDREKNSQKLAALPGAPLCPNPPCTREPGGRAASGAVVPPATPREVAGLKLGRFYALVIGNQNYRQIEALQTPIDDAAAAAQMLRSKYGFTVTVLNDADDVAMLQALNDLNAVLKPDDNLMIYYAGHGTRLRGAGSERGYWLPVNSNPPPNSTFWVPNGQVTDYLMTMQARRILIVADSCYAGLLSDDPNVSMIGDPRQVTLNWIRYKLPSRARLLISSGGDEPVLDSGSGSNSVFARAFLDVLGENQGVMSAPGLFMQVKDRVKAAAARTGFNQAPELKVIGAAGHVGGDFFFVPVAGQ